MIAELKKMFTTEMLIDFSDRFDLQYDSLVKLGSFINIVYRGTKKSTEYILRISHSSERSEKLLKSEIEWMNYLNSNHIKTPVAIESLNKHFIETCTDMNGGFFFATLFKVLPGKHISFSNKNPRFYENYGKVIGRIHASSKKFQAESSNFFRPQLFDGFLKDVEENLPENESKVCEMLLNLKEYYKTLEKDSDSFGLTHQDPHKWNLFVDEDENISIFDFDDCCYSWFISDIAVVLFYIPFWGSGISEELLEEFFVHFYRGYLKENSLDSRWLKEIPHFLKLRELDMYGLIKMNYDGQIADTEFAEIFLKDRKVRIEQGVPFVSVDFEKIAYENGLVN